jgi:hypothetical protein
MTRSHLVEESEERRELALGFAVQLASSQQVGKYDGDIVVNIATKFESFLKGPTEPEGSTN